MNRKALLVAATVIPAAIAAAPTSASAQIPGVDWQVGSAIALGSGCSSSLGDTQFIAFGNQATVLFSRFGVDLPAGGPDLSLAQLKNCSVRIPATIRRGWYLSQLVQTITYGVNKSQNTSGRITSLASFFNTPVASFTVNIPFGAINNPAVTQTKSTPLVVTAACSPNPLAGLYRSDLAVSGNRSTRNESMLVAMQGLDLRYDILFPVVLCPFP